MPKIELTPEGWTKCGKWRLVPSEMTDAMRDDVSRMPIPFCDLAEYAAAIQVAPTPPADLFDAEPVADADGWIPWGGGECPIPDGAEHQVKFQNGTISLPDSRASTWAWDGGTVYRIIAYRLPPHRRTQMTICAKYAGKPVSACTRGKDNCPCAREFTMQEISNLERGISVDAERIAELEAELAQERKRLDWALKNGVKLIGHGSCLLYDLSIMAQGYQFVATDNPRATIDKLMGEG